MSTRYLGRPAQFGASNPQPHPRAAGDTGPRRRHGHHGVHLPLPRRSAHGVFLACLGMAGVLHADPARAQVGAPGAAASAAANDASQGATVETIKVTARKRDEKMIEVPISMQAFSADSLKAQGIYDLQDLTAQAGFTYTQTTGTGAGGRAFGVLTFRGLSGDGGQWFENSGALFIDGIFVSGGVSSVSTVEVARVEVLKGPQNAFFGRSTFGGAINFITRDPATTLKGQANTTMTQRGSFDADATIEGPLVSGLARGRVTVASHRKAALLQASDGGDMGAESGKSVTGTLYVTPSDDLWLRLRGHYQKDDDSEAAIGGIVFNGNTSCNGRTYPGTNASGASQPFTPAQPYACAGIPRLGDTNVFVDANTALPPAVYGAFVHNSLNAPFVNRAPALDHSGMARETKRASLQAGYHLPLDMDLAVNLGHNEVNSMAIWDLDRSATPNFINAMPILTRDTTFDLRLTTSPQARLRGLLGASYFTSTQQLVQIDYNLPFGATAPTINTGNYNNYNSKVPAFYGSLEFDITDRITATVDARYQTDRIVSTSYAGVSYHSEKKNWLPRATLRFMPDRDTMTYVTAAQGVQPLTTNSGYTGSNDTQKAYISGVVPGSSDFSPQPKLSSLELGWKQRLLNNRVQTTLAVYDERWQNRLTNSYLFNPGSCTPAQALTPACPLPASGTFVVFGNEARIRGLEFALDAVVTPQWSVAGTLDYKRARWSHYVNSSLSSLTGGTPASTTSGFDGNTLAKVPDWTATINSTYRAPLSAGWTGYLRGDLVYVGRAWDTDFDIVQTDPYTLVNLRLGFEKTDTTVELFVKNLFNDQHWTSVVRSADLTFTPLNNFNKQIFLTGLQNPREFGIRLSHRF